jgi:5-(carboxyamino)imidazole ribonucleotide synthase
MSALAPLADASAPPTGPAAVVGMVGGGQLARMTQQAAIALGVELRVLTPSADDPAVRAGAVHIPGRPGDPAALAGLAAGCDVVTFDHEHAPVALLEQVVADGAVVRPHPRALLLAQDKTVARRALDVAGFPVPAFVEVAAGDVDGVREFARVHGWPVVVKLPQGGYDGRGVSVVDGPGALADVPEGPTGRWLLEAAVPIATELAVLVARRPSGHWVTYPVVETVQRDGICHELVMPADVPADLARRAVDLAVAVAGGIDATGILAVELFVTVDGGLVVNELATRPHNSGHATIDAAVTSQFENHLRAVLDWPLGDPSLRAPAAATVNVLGPAWPVDPARTLPLALEDPAVRVHWYGKAAWPGRKLGHVTAVGPDRATALTAARRAADLVVAP